MCLPIWVFYWSPKSPQSPPDLTFSPDVLTSSAQPPSPSQCPPASCSRQLQVQGSSDLPLSLLHTTNIYISQPTAATPQDSPHPVLDSSLSWWSASCVEPPIRDFAKYFLFSLNWNILREKIFQVISCQILSRGKVVEGKCITFLQGPIFKS